MKEVIKTFSIFLILFICVLVIPSLPQHKKQQTFSDTPLMEAASSGNIKVLDSLLAHHVDINIKDVNGYSAFRKAVNNSQLGAAKRLLESGADIDTQDNEGRTPLMNALFFSEDIDIIKFLINAHADLNIKSNHNETALSFALILGKHDIIKALVLAGAK